METLLEHFQGSPWAIWALFGLLLLCGMGLPMPEDVILIAAGLITAENGGSWVKAAALMYFGVLAGDSMVFVIGRYFGARLLASRWVHRWLNPAKQARIEKLFARYGSFAFFFARFMPGLRAPIFCSAGAMKVRYVTFVFFDGLAALISVPFFVWLGNFLWRRFGEDLEQLSKAMSKTHTYTLVFAIAVTVGIILIVWYNRRKLARAMN